MDKQSVVQCKYCGIETKGYTTCRACMDAVDRELYKAAAQLKRPKPSAYWIDLFRHKYTQSRITESMWRLVDTHKGYINSNLEFGVRE